MRLNRFSIALLLVLTWLLVISAGVTRAADAGKVYVVLWFDTEDYILPADDDASLRLAEFLSRENIRATFKLVGEKARTLERRGRTDVIGALKKHEIGYHSNWHSVQPTPAMYLSNLGWDEGIAEFDRRERPGYEDVKRIFGTPPTCYGQPGSSWGPQVYGAMKQWGMEVYLDAGSHVGLEDRPCYYCGILNLYKLEFILRADLDGKNLKEAEDKFLAARKKLAGQGGGIISIFYHPCEFVHKEFWDGVNFRKGANPPREKWKMPREKNEEEKKIAYQVFEDYIHFMKRFPDVQFITATEAVKVYRDKAHERFFRSSDIKALARGVGDKVNFQKLDGCTVAPSEVFLLLNQYMAVTASSRRLTPAGKGNNEKEVAMQFKLTPYGPTGTVKPLSQPLTTDWSQFSRTASDVNDFLLRHQRIPSSVWLGSVPVPPEAYLSALAGVTIDLIEGKPAPETIEIKPTKLAAGSYVADDGPNLWGWVIFPDGFRAPEMMALAKKQAWTMKPAILARD
jgi:hypothetical protein